MKIKDRSVMVEFHELLRGDTFSCDGEYCMKTTVIRSQCPETLYNAVVLSDGSMWHIDDHQVVTQVKGHFEID